MAATGSNCLAVVLRELGWSYTRLIAELRRHASVALPKTESMVTLVSRWVNNHQQPDDFYRDLLSRATGRATAELFSEEPLGLTALPSHLVVARSGDGLPATGEGPLSSGGDGLIAWLGQQDSELKDGGVERRSFVASLALLGVDLTALAPASSAQAGSASEQTLTVDGALLRDLDLTTAAYAGATTSLWRRSPCDRLTTTAEGCLPLAGQSGAADGGAEIFRNGRDPHAPGEAPGSVHRQGPRNPRPRHRSP
jgi:hypothetical protein